VLLDGLLPPPPAPVPPASAIAGGGAVAGRCQWQRRALPCCLAALLPCCLVCPAGRAGDRVTQAAAAWSSREPGSTELGQSVSLPRQKGRPRDQEGDLQQPCANSRWPKEAGRGEAGVKRATWQGAKTMLITRVGGFSNLLRALSGLGSIQRCRFLPVLTAAPPRRCSRCQPAAACAAPAVDGFSGL
jgi:hypothetical protein